MQIFLREFGFFYPRLRFFHPLGTRQVTAGLNGFFFQTHVFAEKLRKYQNVSSQYCVCSLPVNNPQTLISRIVMKHCPIQAGSRNCVRCTPASCRGCATDGFLDHRTKAQQYDSHVLRVRSSTYERCQTEEKTSRIGVLQSQF